MVHYVGYGHTPACLPAIITKVVSNHVVDLTVFMPLPHHVTSVALDTGGEQGTWHWPERVG
jgi:hypothetical protein